MPALLHIPEVWPGPPHRVSTEFLIGQLSTHSGRKSYRSQRRSRSRPGPPRHRSLPRLPSSRSGPEPPRRSSRPAEPLIRSAPSPPVRVSFPLPPEIESALDPPRTVSEPASPRRVCRSTLPPNESRPLPPLTVSRPPASREPSTQKRLPRMESRSCGSPRSAVACYREGPLTARKRPKRQNPVIADRVLVDLRLSIRRRGGNGHGGA